MTDPITTFAQILRGSARPEERPFRRENTGYYHLTAGPMSQHFVLA